MFKFSKMMLLFVLALSLVACGSLPTGVSKSEFKEAEKIVNIINYHYENQLELNDDDKSLVDSYFDNLVKLQERGKIKDDSIDFHADILKLYSSYLVTVGFIDISNKISGNFAESYNEYKYNLKNIGINFEDTDK